MYQHGFSVSFGRYLTDSKSFFSANSADQMKKQAKIGVLLQPPWRYSLIVFQFWNFFAISIYNNIPKCSQTLHLINSKNLLGEFYVPTAPGFWTMPLLISLKMCLRVSIKNVASTVSFSVTSDAVLNFQKKPCIYTVDN